MTIYFKKFLLVLYDTFLCFKANHTTPLEDLSGNRGNQCMKVFIQRDYSEGTMVKFQTRRPPELEDKVIIKTIIVFF